MPPTARRFKIVSAVLVAAVFGIGSMLAFSGAAHLKPDAAASVGAAAPLQAVVVGLGRLEPQAAVVQVSSPSGAGQGARIGRLYVAEGDAVSAGQALAELDSAARLDAELDSARANVALKQLLLARARAEAAETTTRRRLALARAEADLAVKQADFARYEQLGRSNFASPQLREQKRLEMVLAERTREEMLAQLKRSETQFEGAQIDIAQAMRELGVAQAALALAQAQRDDAVIRAPSSGRVLQLFARAGERVGSDGVLEIGATQTMAAIVEIYENDVPKLRVGQQAQVRAAVLGPEPLEGRVSRIGLAVRRQSVVNADPTANTDNRVVQVQVLFDEEGSRRAAAFTRLQVRAAIQVEAPQALVLGK
jgi:HlyD family secretion protein